MYPDRRVSDFVTQHFVPVRVHVKHQAQQFQDLGERYSAMWTPTILILDEAGEARHRIEGFLPVDDFLSQLALGLGHAAFSRGDFEDASKLFEAALAQHPDTDAAPEAQYWSGVARYKASGDAAALADTARRFDEKYSNSTWAKKASVWKS